ncbi:MAG: hypothetical protein GX573_12535 [Chloroflexi bacterium]|nr:hypothetical protein [Chloroflexota bacterium]
MKVDKAMARYLDIYQKLYQRAPRELRDLGKDWVLVNGARMSVDQLESLTGELLNEYEQYLRARRGAVQRLLNWFQRA